MASPIQNSSASAIENFCSICLLAIEKNDHKKKIGCDHEFHFACIETWMNMCRAQDKNVSCPLCRYLIEPLAANHAIDPAIRIIRGDELLFDREVFLDTLRQNGPQLQYASQALRNDLQVILAAVRQDGPALQYAPQEDPS